MEKRPTVSISPHFKAEKLDDPTVEDLIDVFEDRIKYIVLEPAGVLLNSPFGDFAALGLLLTYFEGFAIYTEGESSKGSSQTFFVKGFVDVFSDAGMSRVALETLARVMYSDARCGFFHEGMMRERIYVGDVNRAIAATFPVEDGAFVDSGPMESALINVSRLRTMVVRHFEQWMRALRNTGNTAARNRFARAFKNQCDWTKEGPVMAIRARF